MDYTYLKARAKINLSLDIVGKRPDGYHEMKMIMQSLQLYDGLFMKKTSTPGVRLVCNLKWLPVDERNLVYQAAQSMIESYGIQSGVFIELTKTIPVSAGLGGGSSDCAAALVGMRRLFDLTIGNRELMRLGLTFGADVPFCLYRGTALAEGVGEKITPIIPGHPPVTIVVARPPVRVSTADVFANYDSSRVIGRPDTEKMISDIRKGSVRDIANGFCNVLESVTERMHPTIKDIKELLMRNNSLGACMSGSGPSVFGYFTQKADALAAIRAIKTNLPEIHEIFFTSVFHKNMGK